MCISNVKKGMKFIMNYYEILEVPYDASFSNIKSSYLRLAKKNYPDMFSQQDDGERMKQLNEAYAVLKNKKKRALYDRWLSDEFVKASKLLKDNLNENMDEVKKINKDCNQILKANYMQNLSKLKELRQNGYGVSNLRFLLSASIGSIALIDAVTIPLFMNNGVVLFVNIGGLLIMLLVFRKLVTSNNYDV